MLRFAFAAALSLAVADMASAARPPIWSVHPGFFSPGYAGVEVLDLDGDGRQEAVVTGTVGFDYTDATSLLAVLGHHDGSVRADRIVPLPNGAGISGRIHVEPAAAGRPARLLAMLSRSNAPPALATFAGLDLRLVSEVAMPHGFWLHGVGDIDGDGALEAYGANGGTHNPQVVDAATGAVEWTGLTLSAFYVRAGQLDADAALELVLGTDVPTSNDTAGYALDGATHAIEWAYASGFVGMPVFGNFDADPASREFAIVSRGDMRVFVTTPFYSPLTDHAVRAGSALAVGDADGDGIDEIVVGEDQWGDVVAYSPTDWSTRFRYRIPRPGVSAVGVGELDGDPGMEVVFGSGLCCTPRAETLTVIDSRGGLPEFEQPDEVGPYSNVLVADFDQNGTRDVVYATFGSSSIYTHPNLRMLDGATGSELRKLGNAGARLLAANLDADPQLEIIAAGGSYSGGRLTVIDPLLSQVQWDVDRFESEIAAMALTDAGGDSVPDIVATGGGRVYVIDGATGAEIWRSVRFTPTGRPTLAVGDVDGDAAREIVLGAGNGDYYVLDQETRLLERTFSHADEVIGQTIEGSGAECRFVLFETYRLVRRRCDTSGVDSERTYAVTATFVRPVTDSHGTLVLSDGDRVFMQEGTAIVAASTSLGPKLGWNNKGTVIGDSTAVTVFTGGSFGVHRVELRAHVFHSAGFE